MLQAARDPDLVRKKVAAAAEAAAAVAAGGSGSGAAPAKAGKTVEKIAKIAAGPPRQQLRLGLQHVSVLCACV